jgi:hypothetical protein
MGEYLNIIKVMKLAFDFYFMAQMAKIVFKRNSDIKKASEIKKIAGF